MTIRLLIATSVFCMASAQAQKNKEYPVLAGEIPAKVLPNEAIYVSKEFKAGTASFKNGSTSNARFDYNYLLDEMHFINDAGDTLAIAEPALINSVTIDTSIFYYDSGYVQQIMKQGDYKLAIKREMVQINDKKKGGYDVSTGISSIQTYGSVSGNGQIYNLEVKKDVLFKPVFSFYIASGHNRFLKANKKNFNTIFDEKKVSEYLKNHKVNFNKEEDLKALLQFCAA